MDPTLRLAPRARAIALLALLLGIGTRVFTLLERPVTPLRTCDGAAYWDMAINFAQGRGFAITDPDLPAICHGIGLGPSHHYSPLMSAYEAPFAAAFGEGALGLAAALILLSAAVVAVAYATTKDLFGADAALLVAAVVALDWTGVFFGTRMGYSENLVELTFILTFWGILRGLRGERWIVVAGLAAGLGYLSKASAGWFFLLAGLGGLAWRLAYQGWGVLRNRSYLAAIAVFGVFVAGWSLRNLYHFWDGTPRGLLTDWQTSAYTASAVAASLRTPVSFFLMVLAKLFLLTLGLALPLAPLWPAVRGAASRWREEAVSGLLLGVGLILVLGAVFAAALGMAEGTRASWGDSLRYAAPAQVPLLWLAAQHPTRRPVLAWTATFGISFVLCLVAPELLRSGRPLGP